MLKRSMCALFAVGMVMLGAVQAAAVTQTGVIRVTLDDEESIVTLYRVGEIENTGYRLAEDYGGGSVTFEELISAELAEQLAQEAETGIQRGANEQGIAEFGGLEEGIYLLVQTRTPQGQYPFSPLVLTIPWDGNQWDVEVSPRVEPVFSDNPPTGQHPAPIIMAMILVVSGVGIIICLDRNKRRRK